MISLTFAKFVLDQYDKNICIRKSTANLSGWMFLISKLGQSQKTYWITQRYIKPLWHSRTEPKTMNFILWANTYINRTLFPYLVSYVGMYVPFHHSFLDVQGCLLVLDFFLRFLKKFVITVVWPSELFFDLEGTVQFWHTQSCNNDA